MLQSFLKSIVKGIDSEVNEVRLGKIIQMTFDGSHKPEARKIPFLFASALGSWRALNGVTSLKR